MNIVFATSGLEFNGESINQPGGLGGSETAVLYMARELAKLGNRVAVYCRCPKPGVFDGVHYVDITNFVQMNINIPIDVLVVSRFGGLFSPLIDGAVNVFWLHDMPASREQFMPATIKADMVFTLSDYHCQKYMEMSQNHLGRVMERTSNGVDLELILNTPPQPASSKYTHRFLYSSLPERGLLPLLKDIWPKILEQLPESQLLVAGYDINSVKNAITPDVLALRDQCSEMISQMPSVRHLGGLNKTMLYSVMKSCNVMLYPCTFPEIFCITAVEAQGCGLPVCTTDSFALPETVSRENGVLVPLTEKYIPDYIDAAVKLATNPTIKETMKVTGPKWVRDKGFEWHTIAAKWHDKFNKYLDIRVRDNAHRIASAAVRRKDLVVAKSLEDTASLIPEAEQKLQPYLMRTDTIDKVPTKVLGDVDRDVMWDLAFGMVKRARPDAAEKGITFLEYCSCEGPFSLFAATQSPTSKFTVVFEDMAHIPDYKELENYPANVEVVTKSQLMEFSASDRQFDCIMLGPSLATAQYPNEKFRAMVSNLVAPDCLFLSVTPYGSIGMSELECKHQKWSLDLDDLQAMFGDFQDFGAAFATLYTGERGERLGYWVSYFTGKETPGKINLHTKARRIRPEQVLTACIIAKNEERWVGMCLAELKDVVDQFVIGDCYSTDHTRQIAGMFPNVEIFSIDFVDFAQARNETLERAAGDWILVIDCDERLVEAGKMRKYLEHPMPECFVVKQNHLSLDAEKAFDQPVRLFRNRPEYRYAGCIHEHITNVSGGNFEGNMGPAYELGEAEIAHYGYVIESLRKKKVVLRNLDLLIKDAKENLPKGREVIWLLAIRDYMNAVKWSMRSVNDFNLVANSFEHFLLESVVRTYHAKFRSSQPKFWDKIFPIYQEAMSFLGRSHLTFSDTKSIPFQVALTLYADHENIDREVLNSLQPNTIWFLHPAEVREFMDRQSSELTTKMFANYTGDSRDVAWDYKPEVPDPVEVLTKIREKYRRIG